MRIYDIYLQPAIDRYLQRLGLSLGSWTARRVAWRLGIVVCSSCGCFRSFRCFTELFRSLCFCNNR